MPSVLSSIRGGRHVGRKDFVHRPDASSWCEKKGVVYVCRLYRVRFALEVSWNPPLHGEVVGKRVCCAPKYCGLCARELDVVAGVVLAAAGVEVGPMGSSRLPLFCW